MLLSDALVKRSMKHQNKGQPGNIDSVCPTDPDTTYTAPHIII